MLPQKSKNTDRTTAAKVPFLGNLGWHKQARRGGKSFTSIVVLLVGTGLFGPVSRSRTEKGQPKQRTGVRSQMSGLSMGLIENRGQFVDDRGNAVPQVLFMSSLGPVDFYVTTTGVSFVFTHNSSEGRSALPSTPNDRQEGAQRYKHEWRQIQMELLGSRIKRENIIAEMPTGAQFNYYLAHCRDGIVGVRTFQRVTIRSVYPGIDWRLTRDVERGLKQEFIVHPGASPRDIRLSYTGAGNATVSDEGRLLRIKTDLGELAEGPLVSYLDNPRRPIDSRYEMQGDHVGLAVSKYDGGSTLVIDPPIQLVWSTLLGGNNYYDPLAIASDAGNNVYVVGYTNSSTFPTVLSGSAYIQPFATGATTNAFIAKFNVSGVLVWATYYGGKQDNQAEAVATDSLGNVFVAGYTTSTGTSFPTLAPPGSIPYQPTNAGSSDAFILKFDPNGVRLWATLFGGSLDDAAHGIETDSAGNAYLVGETYSTNLPVLAPTTTGAYWQPTFGGGFGDAFIVKYLPSGKVDWSTYYGGSDFDAGYAVAWNGSRIYITGTTLTPNLPLINSGGYFQPVNAGQGDLFLLGMDTNAVCFWATYYGAARWDRPTAIAKAPNGEIYVTGFSYGMPMTVTPYFPTLNGGKLTYYQPIYNKLPGFMTSLGPRDAFILRFDSKGTRLWATLFGGADADSGTGATVDARGLLWVTGDTASQKLFPTKNPGYGYFDGTLDGLSDLFIAHFRVDETTVYQSWTTFAGGTNQESGRGIAALPQFVGSAKLTCVVATGLSYSPGSSLPLVNPGGGAYFQTSNLGIEGLIMKFCY